MLNKSESEDESDSANFRKRHAGKIERVYRKRK
jgi:hypothetical protein